MELGQREERGGLNTKLDRFIKLFEPKKKGRKTKLPKLPKIKKAKLRQNYALVIYIMDNLNMNIEWIPIENEYIYIKKTNTYHLATSKYVLNYKGMPTIFQPTWRLEPFCPSSDYSWTQKLHGDANPQKVLITLMEQANLKIKGKMGKKAMIWVIIGIAVILYFVSTILTGGTP